MMRSRFSEIQIAAMLNEGEAGILVVELCHKHSNATYYHWKSRYSNVQVHERMSYSDYLSWKLKMPSSNACSRSGVGECSDQRRSKPKILIPLAGQLVQTRLLATIEWSQLEQETYKLDILRHGFDYAFATQKKTAGSTSAAFRTGQCAELLLRTGFMHDTLYCGRRFRGLNVIDEVN